MVNKQIIRGIPDGLSNRIQELERTRNEFARLLNNLPSDYVSEIAGSNYSLFLRMFAEEYARLRSLLDAVYLDGRYKDTRVEYLYQNLGHRLHALDSRINFFPDLEYDEDYRRFVLALLYAVLNGARVDSLLNAGASASGLDSALLELIEFFKRIPPRQDPSPFNVSDRNFWRFKVTLPPPPINLGVIYLGLLFVGRLIKPAHTLFDVQLLFPDTINPEFERGCCQILAPAGYLRASRVKKSRFVSPDETFDNCVRNGRKIRAKVTQVYDAGPPATIEVGGVTVQITPNTIFQDIDNIYTSVLDLQIDDIVEIDGFTFDYPLTLDGFTVQEKLAPTAICVRNKWKLEEYRYRSYRICRQDQLECYQVQNEVVNWANFPTRREFIVQHYPLASNDSECNICYQTIDNGKTVVGVFLDDGVTVTPLDVLFVDPYTGRVVLAADAPPTPSGTVVRVDYRYWKGQPILGMVFDSDGLLYDQNVNCESQYSIFDHLPNDEFGDFEYSLGDGPNIQQALFLNDDEDLLNEEDDLLNGGPGVTSKFTTLHCQLPHTEPEPTFKVDYSGFQVAHSTLYDTDSAVFDEPSAYRNKFDDYNVIGSRGFDILKQEEFTPQEVLDSIVADQEHRVGTILVPWTQDWCNGVNRIFQRETFVPEFSDLLNSMFSFLNTTNLELNDAITKRVRDFAKDLYTCLIAFTRFTEINEGEGFCTLRPKSRMCFGITLAFTGP